VGLRFLLVTSNVGSNLVLGMNVCLRFVFLLRQSLCDVLIRYQGQNINTVIRYTMAQAVKLLACILKVPGSNLGEILSILIDRATSRLIYCHVLGV
jgi:hypothetical protein